MRDINPKESASVHVHPVQTAFVYLQRIVPIPVVSLLPVYMSNCGFEGPEDKSSYNRSWRSILVTDKLSVTTLVEEKMSFLLSMVHEQ